MLPTFLAAGLAGATSCASLYPLDVVRSRLMCDTVRGRIRLVPYPFTSSPCIVYRAYRVSCILCTVSLQPLPACLPSKSAYVTGPASTGSRWGAQLTILLCLRLLVDAAP